MSGALREAAPLGVTSTDPIATAIRIAVADGRARRGLRTPSNGPTLT